ncbi:DUF6768 family protein [Caulobacter sp. NIBR1757]|uniref:DUF6768 family protein n=1 Tax=Caulobacter sp. NIBR1757 TaxID=3016000 RepID=UPI0022F09B63|nr:DUF6768 family protein [Caulobacter sp. NIBR1757]WGM37714.1 hypothetical protein AMEJIAPC_00614 [Caulobacter sp. NIBR1757]
MTPIDEALRRALSPEELRALADLGGEEPIIRQALRAFEDQQVWVRLVGWAGGFGLFAVAAWAGWRFVGAADQRQMLLWGALAAVAMLGLVMIKLWFFMEMQKNTIVREVKRLELQVASLIRLQGASG